MLKKLKLFLLILLLSSCARNLNPPQPRVFLRLGQSDHICAGKDNTARVNIFVTLEKPANAIFKVNDKQIAILGGKDLHLELARAGVGSHKLEVIIPDIRQEPYTKHFSVWSCPGIEYGKLRRKDGTLKGYDENDQN